MGHSNNRREDMVEDEEEDSRPRRNNKKSNDTLAFTVWEVDKVNKNIPGSVAFECYNNPIPAIRYAYRMNKRPDGRHHYIISPRPHDAMYVAAGVNKERI